MSNVPEIRFKGFTDAWAQRRLGDVADLVAGGDIDKSRLREYGKYPVIANALTNDGIVGYYESDYRIEAPAVTVTGRGDVGYAQARTTNFTPVVRLLAIKSDFDVDFLANAINMLDIFIESTGVPQLTSPQLSNYGIAYPSKKNEQTRIGTFFRTLDNTIALRKRKLDGLRKLKKAYLQQMFPQAGERIPKIRFAGFTEEWAESKLLERSKLITKGTTPLNKTDVGSVNFIKVENISGGIIRPVSKVTKEEHENYLKRSILRSGDILFSIAGTLGRIAIVKDSILPANTNQALAIIRGYEFDVGFLLIFLESKVVSDFVRRNPTVGAQPNLSLEQIGQLSIFAPTLLEQKVIGNFFRNLGEKITNQAKKIEQLQQLKSAFSQKMFV